MFQEVDEKDKSNRAIHVLSNIMRNVMSSAAEAEIGSLYENGKKGIEIRLLLEEMGHKQPPTPIPTDNSTAEGIMNKNIIQKITRAMDMRYYWMRDQVQQGQYRVYWKPGKTNLADYFTKHHPPAHHREMRQKYMVQRIIEVRDNLMRGCVDISQCKR